MNLITPLLFTLAIIGTAAASSSTPSVRAIKGVESTRNLQYGGYGGGYNPSSSSSSGGGSSHHKTKPKPKQKTTPKPKKPKAKPHKPSSHSSSNSSGSYSSQPYYGYSKTTYAYSAVGMLGIVAAIMAKKKCTCASASQDDKDGPDASDILRGDYGNDSSTITSISGMTDSKAGKSVYIERLNYFPSEIETTAPPPPPTETNNNVTDGAAIV